jgi:hypothetical protein
MSQLTHPRIHTLELSFKLRMWLAAALVAVAVAIPTVLVISDDDDSGQSAQPAAAAGLRYDGGPDEGTRGVRSQSYSASERGSDTFGARP